MAGNLAADGRFPGPSMPPTERVENVRLIAETLIFEQVAGKRSWEELLRVHLAEEYVGYPEALERAIAISLTRIDNGYVPTILMNVFRDNVRFNEMAACK